MTRIKLGQEGHHKKKVVQSSSVEEDDSERKIWWAKKSGNQFARGSPKSSFYSFRKKQIKRDQSFSHLLRAKKHHR